jgi:hypothetical protein
MLKTNDCIKKRKLIEAAKAEVETTPDSLRVQVNRTLKRLSKRGEIYISGEEICRGVHINKRVLEALNVPRVPPLLSVLFEILTDIAKGGGNLDDSAFETFAEAVEAALNEYRVVGVRYDPSDVGDAVLALALFKLFLKWYSERRRKRLAEIYLALPETTVVDLLQARWISEDTRRAGCVAKCFHLLPLSLQNYSSVKAHKDIDVVIIGNCATQSGYNPFSTITRPLNKLISRSRCGEECKKCWFGGEISRDVAFVGVRYGVLKYRIEIEGHFVEVRGKRYLLFDNYKFDNYKAVFILLSDVECLEECLPVEPLQRQLDPRIRQELEEILQMFRELVDYRNRLMWLARYIRITPEVSKSKRKHS